MFSPEVFQRALLARQGQGQGDMWNPDAQLDTSRMSDLPVAIPGLSFTPEASFPAAPNQELDPMQILMALLTGQ